MGTIEMPDKDTLRARIDGKEYSLDGQMTLGEQRLFKQVGGLRLAELEEALNALDQDALIVLAMIMKRRAGETCTLEDAERIVDMELLPNEDGAVDDAVPPPSPAADSPPSEDVASPSPVAQLPSRETNPNSSGTPSSQTASA